MQNANFLGIVSATSFVGDGSNLDNIITGVGLATEGGYVGSGATTLDFRGPGMGVVTIDVVTGIGTINVEGGRDIDEIGSANQVLFKDNTNTATTSANLQFNGTDLTCAGTVTANSDERLKKNVKTIDDALNKVRSLRGVEYDHKKTGDHCLGLIAQEVEEIIPDVVYEDATGVKSVAYMNIVALLIEAIKDQQRQIDELKRQLD
jgi:Tol biopolymer transport system component